MHVISRILFVTLLSGIQVKHISSDGTHASRPRMVNHIIHDWNSKIKYLVNQFDQNFITLLTTSPPSTNSLKLYVTKDGGLSIKQVDLRFFVSNVTIDDMQSTKDYSFLVSYMSHKFTYLDIDGNLTPIRSFEENSKLIVHPNDADIILKANPSGLFLSKNKGDTFIKLCQEYSKYSWSSHYSTMITICDGKLVQVEIYTFKKHEIYTMEEKISFFSTENQIAFQVYNRSSGTIRVGLWYGALHSYQFLHFPNLLILKNLIYVEHYKKYIYVVVETDQQGVCLFSSIFTSTKLVRLSCFLQSSDTSNHFCPIYITGTEGVMYINKFDEICSTVVTFVSRNNGNSWHRVRLNGFPNEIMEHKSCLRLFLPCSNNHQREWTIDSFDIKSGESFTNGEYKKGQFYSYDWGESWSMVPEIKSKLISINMGYLLLGINYHSHIIQYSFDEGDSWHQRMIDADKIMVIDIISVDKAGNPIITILSQANQHGNIEWVLTTMDFTPVLSRVCGKTDFVTVETSHNQSRCFRGYHTECFRKLKSSLCRISEHGPKCHQKNSCPCTIEDFECVYGFYFSEGHCVRDPYHKHHLENDTCASHQKSQIHLIGYRKIRHDHCSLPEAVINKTISAAEYCQNLDERSFLVLVQSNRFGTIDITDNGVPYAKSTLEQHVFHKNRSIPLKYAINFDSLQIYFAINKTIYIKEHGSDYYNIFDYPIFEESLTISSIDFDPVSNSIIYNDEKGNLFMVNLKTNFKEILTSDVSNFKFYPSIRAISFLRSDTMVCYTHLREHNICFRHKDLILSVSYDEKNHHFFYHYKNKTLVVYKQDRFIDSNRFILAMINGVDLYDYMNQEIYFTIGFGVYHTNLNFPHKIIRLLTHKFEGLSKIYIHKYSNAQYHSKCKSSKCSYSCDDTIEGENNCICPPNAHMINHTCVCEGNMNCFKPFCLGYWCDDGSCIPMTPICKDMRKCLSPSYDKNCVNLNGKKRYKIPITPNTKTAKTKTKVIIPVVLVGVVVIGLLSFLFYRWFKKYQYSSNYPNGSLFMNWLIREQNNDISFQTLLSRSDY